MIEKNLLVATNFPNLVLTETSIDQPNRLWFVNFGDIELTPSQTIHFLLVMDAYSNEIFRFAISIKKPIYALDLVRRLETSLKMQGIQERKDPKLIIHTTREIPFLSEKYLSFTEKYKNYFQASMNTDNETIGEFVTSFKELILDETGKNIVQCLKNKYQNEKFDIEIITSVFKNYIEHYNKKEKKTEANNSSSLKPEPLTQIVKPEPLIQTIEPESLPQIINPDPESLMIQSPEIQPVELEKSFSIVEYKNQLVTLSSEVNQNVALSLVKPFLLNKINLIEKKIDQQLDLSLNIKDGIENQSKKMDFHFQNIANAIDSLNQEIQKLKEKTEKKRISKLQLRDGITEMHYEYFLLNAGQRIYKLQQLRAAQLRIIYTILYFVGLRLNEVRLLTKNDLLLAIETEEFNIIHTKTSECQKHILPKGAVAKLKSLLPEIDYLFEKNGFKYLGNSHRFSEKVFHETNFIRFVNDDMTATCETYHFLSNFSSHSFRVGYITKLLKTLPVQQVASIIGHKDIESTMVYQRSTINKDDIQDLLKTAFLFE